MSDALYDWPFDPYRNEGLEDLRQGEEKTQATTGDRRDGKVYLYDEKGRIILAVNVALATGRPLLVSGPSGGGKSSLAFHVARVLERRYYEFVVTARTEARDLTWRFDVVRRLADAQVPGRLNDTPATQYLNTIYPYIEPGDLWWIYDRKSALRRGRSEPDSTDRPKDPAKWDPAYMFGVGLDLAQELDAEKLSATLRKRFAEHGIVLAPEACVGAEQAGREWTIGDAGRQYLVRREDQTLSVRDPSKEASSAVLLIDEIDKADPDVPNNLLVELGSLEFDVDLIGQRIKFQGDRNDWQQRPLIIITTNRERPLPVPFLRRCVALEIDYPKRKLLWKIAAANFPAENQPFFDHVLDALLRSKTDALKPVSSADDAGEEPMPVSIAEFVDTVRACVSLRRPGTPLSEVLLADIVEKTGSGWKEKDRAR